MEPQLAAIRNLLKQQVCNLSFIFRIKNCPSRSELEIMLKRNIDREPKQCYVDQKTHPQYRQAASKFTFLFNATSPLKPSGKISIHKVNHLEIGKKAVLMSCLTHLSFFKFSNNFLYFYFMHKIPFTYFTVFRPLIRIVSPIAQYRVLSPSSNCPPHSTKH